MGGSAVTSGAWRPLAGRRSGLRWRSCWTGRCRAPSCPGEWSCPPGSLTRLTKPMLESGLLVEVPGGPTIPGWGGLRSRSIVVPTSHHFVGVKLTGDAAIGVLTTLRAEVIATAERPLTDHTPSAVADVVVELATISLGAEPTADHRARHHVSAARSPTRGEVRAAPSSTGSTYRSASWSPSEPTPGRRRERPDRADRGDPLVRGRSRDRTGSCLITIGAGVGYGLVDPQPHRRQPGHQHRPDRPPSADSRRTALRPRTPRLRARRADHPVDHEPGRRRARAGGRLRRMPRPGRQGRSRRPRRWSARPATPSAS